MIPEIFERVEFETLTIIDEPGIYGLTSLCEGEKEDIAISNSIVSYKFWLSAAEVSNYSILQRMFQDDNVEFVDFDSVKDLIISANIYESQINDHLPGKYEMLNVKIEIKENELVATKVEFEDIEDPDEADSPSFSDQTYVEQKRTLIESQDRRQYEKPKQEDLGFGERVGKFIFYTILFFIFLWACSRLGGDSSEPYYRGWPK